LWINYNLYNVCNLRHRRVTGARGAVAAAHPAAATAAARMLAAGGSAVDAAVAAQAVISVVLPQAAGLGGDLLALVHHDGVVSAVNGTGCSPHLLAGPPQSTGGSSVTVPGLVDGWLVLHRRWGRLPLPTVLAPAVDLADAGIEADADLLASVDAQRVRLQAGGATAWDLVTGPERPWRQPRVARLLTAIGTHGRAAFYTGAAAAAIVTAVQAHGGAMDLRDLAEHRTVTADPVSVPWRGGTAYVQPPASQGVLLAMALAKVTSLLDEGHTIDDHALIETIGAVFAHRSDCERGAALLAEPLEIDVHHASGRSGPRAYLHTAGVAVADADGQVVSSLISVFDDFGSGVFVPELGVVLNNRAAGFTEGANAAGPAKRPVHTLAPALVTGPDGVTALATPGADGQIQTLLQVLTSTRPLADAVAAPRWRSEDGRLLIEDDHPGVEDLTARGHRIARMTPGEDVFGSVVAAGVAEHPFAVADWRRQTDCAGVP
jgi:gamma-glutamyltranspeptidase / glutathione hydrolase